MAAPDRQPETALADRLISYADAIVALGVVGVSGLGLAVADPEIRTDIARAADWMILSNILSGAVISGLLTLLRSWELDLRSGAPVPAKVQKYSRRLHIARIGVIWLAAVQAAALMLAIR
jgi:hypothetical protein